MNNIVNNPSTPGALATCKKLFGENSRYAVAAVHTRFNAVSWFVWDAERIDDLGFASVIRQANSIEEAIVGL